MKEEKKNIDGCLNEEHVEYATPILSSRHPYFVEESRDSDESSHMPTHARKCFKYKYQNPCSGPCTHTHNFADLK